MKNEMDIHKKAVAYLLSLGWSPNSIVSDYRIDTQHKADIVVTELGHDVPLIVVEVKSKLNLIEVQDPSRLRFNPLVRQLQKYAAAIKADFYLISDGDVFLWLETDETGRPRLLANPILPSTKSESTLSRPLPRQEIIRVFRQLLDHFRFQSDWIIQDSHIALVLLAHFQDVFAKDRSLRNALVEQSKSNTQRYKYVSQFGIPPNELSSTRDISKAFQLLDQTPFENASASNILLAIDDVFLQRIQSLYSVSRWLADGMVTLADLTTDARLLDIATNVGNILAAASMSQSSLEVYGMARNPRNAVWAEVQQVVVGNPNRNILSVDILLDSTPLKEMAKRPTHVVTAPVMGERIPDVAGGSELSLQGVQQVEDLLIEAAINGVAENGRIVFLVPEGLLFGTGKRSKIRRMMLAQTTLVAIISMDNGALKPFSGIRTSIIILENRRPATNHKVFMSTVSNVDDIPYPNTILNCNEVPELAQTIREYSLWSNGSPLLPDAKSWLVPLTEIDAENLSASRYQPSVASVELGNSHYPLVSIGELCQLVKRGRRIKLSDGPLSVIGPATIRPMRTDEDNVGHTSRDEIPSSALKIQRNDVLLNNIGTHLGAAAVVNDLLANSYISQHVMLLRPDLDVIEPEYLAAAINSGQVQDQIMKQATGSVMPSLSIKRLEGLLIPLPDRRRQIEIIRSILSAREKVIATEKELQHLKNTFDTLLANLGMGRNVV